MNADTGPRMNGRTVKMRSGQASRGRHGNLLAFTLSLMYESIEYVGFTRSGSTGE